MGKADPALLRRKVREVLSALPAERHATEEMIRDVVNQLVAVPAEIEDIRTAIEWNQERGFVDFRWNGDEDRQEWLLTERGKLKEGMK